MASLRRLATWPGAACFCVQARRQIAHNRLSPDPLQHFRFICSRPVLQAGPVSLEFPGLVLLPSLMSFQAGKQACQDLDKVMFVAKTSGQFGALETALSSNSSKLAWAGLISGGLPEDGNKLPWSTASGETPASSHMHLASTVSAVACRTVQGDGNVNLSECCEARYVFCRDPLALGTAMDIVFSPRTCDAGWVLDVGGSRCLRMVHTHQTFPRAVATCLSIGGRLLTLGNDTLWSNTALDIFGSDDADFPVWMGVVWDVSSTQWVDIMHGKPLRADKVDAFAHGAGSRIIHPFARGSMSTANPGKWVLDPATPADTAGKKAFFCRHCV